MQTIYLIIFTLIGGFLATFGIAGWRAYTDKNLPATPELFRWFASGTIASGIGAYAWIFGAGGDPGKLFSNVSEALEVKEVMEGLSAAVAGGGEKVANAATELSIGMPTF